MWRLLGSGERPALGVLAIEVVRQQIPDLTPAEWLGLADRLALIDRMLPTGEARTQELLQALVLGRGRR